MPESIDTPATPDAIFGKDAVAAALADHAAIQGLQVSDYRRQVGPQRADDDGRAGDHRAACEAAKAAGYNFFEDVTGVDWYPPEPRFQLSYSILSHGLKQRIRIVVRLEGDTPTLDSITAVWPSANFYEREVFDLFGVPSRTSAADAHHDARQLEGHPLRKDYPVEGYR